MMSCQLCTSCKRSKTLQWDKNLTCPKGKELYTIHLHLPTKIHKRRIQVAHKACRHSNSLLQDIRCYLYWGMVLCTFQKPPCNLDHNNKTQWEQERNRPHLQAHSAGMEYSRSMSVQAGRLTKSSKDMG